jgi:topoisomerase-4 subunit A
MLFSTDGRFFTLDCARLPGGRGNGEAIRTFIDLPPETDVVAMFVHVPGRKLLLAATSGHGFVTSEDDAVAVTRAGKRVMNVSAPDEAVSVAFVAGDSVAAIGENRKILIFDLAEVPEMARGRGVILQRYKDGHLSDVAVFTWKEGLADRNGRIWMPSELKDWKGARAQAGRLPPPRFASGPKPFRKG